MNSQQGVFKSKELTNGPKICYVLPLYDSSTDQHFSHLPHFLSELGKSADVAVIIEKCKGVPSIENVNVIIPQKYGYRNRFLRMLELARIALRLRRAGYKKFFIRISVTAGLTLGLLSRLTGIETFYWVSGQGKDLLPRWSSGFKDFLVRLRAELRFVPFYLATRLVNHFVTGPETMKDYFSREFGVNEKKTIVLYNDIDAVHYQQVRRKADKRAIRKKLGLSPEKKVVLFVGRVSQFKGGANIIPIAEKVFAFDDAVFLVLGIVYLNEVKEEIISKKLEDRIRLLGAVPNSEIADYYLSADVFIMPSESEGFPRVLLESMACGLPFVAFDVGGVKDIVVPEQLDFVVPRGDIDLFAGKVVQLLQDLHLRQKLSEAGLERVKLFSTEKAVQMFLERIVLNQGSLVGSITVSTLNRKMAGSLVKIDSRLKQELGMAYSHEAWVERNFLLDLPAKWELSKAAFADRELVGFWIASRKGDFLHTHRVGVRDDFRGQGIGRKMFAKVLESGEQLGLKEMTLFVSVLNQEAKHFYEDLGFQKLSGRRIRQFLQETGHQAKPSEDRVEESGGCQYYIYALPVKVTREKI